ncbi:DUF1858 domain-containing protein, partial [Thermus scotoductus]|uniref:DUF1858 domain-containing protein n=1 Tax=Thermus scotoductus TaxID=37636 RepID=UPI0020A5D64B
MAGADREEVVHPGMKVAEVLARWPHLLEVLVEASPAFQKLKNPLLRRTMPALVTVAQAARIGGLEPEELVARLNRALGKEGAPQGGGGEAESLSTGAGEEVGVGLANYAAEEIERIKG